MRVLFISSCTGEKKYKPENQLGEDDFYAFGTQEFQEREHELKAFRLPAKDMYTGMQHVLLQKGLERLRSSCLDDQFDLKIISAGYGLIDQDTPIVPYEMTFQGMKAKAIDEWAAHLEIPQKAFPLFDDYDLVFVLLGKEYLRALHLPKELHDPGRLIFLTSKGGARHIPTGDNVHQVLLDNAAAKRLGAALIALKGKVIELLSENVGQNGSQILHQIRKDPACLDTLLQACGKKRVQVQRPSIESVQAFPSIVIPQNWWEMPHRVKMRYFIPEWDDLVNPAYDFVKDEHPDGSSDSYLGAVYAHQIFESPQYDGILVSKVVVDDKKWKKEILGKLGIHKFLRVPRSFPIMGDCGAFGYIAQEEPPYDTEQILDYYQNLDFDYGVSIDHLVVPSILKRKTYYLIHDGNKKEISEKEYQKLNKSGQAQEVKSPEIQRSLVGSKQYLWTKEWIDENEQTRRYDLTIRNAQEFIEKHRQGGYTFQPLGSAQGWSPKSYADCVKAYQDLGYDYIALGGLVRTNTPGIIAVLEAIEHIRHPSTRLHLFGIARPEALQQFYNLGVRSIDSASFLRRAWLGATSNYFTSNGSYAAIRIPQSDKSPRAKKLIREGRVSFEELSTIEQRCLDLLRRYEKRKASVEEVLEAVMTYDDLLGENRKGFEDLFRKTLEDRPWEKCGCTICREIGIENLIFRGNNRNRRRGFHNTKVFYDRFCSLFGDK